MGLMQARMAVAVAVSAAAHAGVVLVLGDRLAPSAAPAARAVTVSMAPAAPRAVLNSIAPAAAETASASKVRAIAPGRVPIVDEPDRRLAARAPRRVEPEHARALRPIAPEKTLRASEPVVRRVAALAPVAIEAASAAAATATAMAMAKLAPTKPVPDRRGAPGEPGADRVARPASGNEPPRYPWSARVRGDQGRVVVSVWVSAEGRAESLSVLVSSGHALLDSAAVEAIERWRFEPARRGGTETASLLNVPVTFRLE